VIFPRFSIRTLIALTFVAALCAYSVARATQNEKWAVAVAITIGSVTLCIVCFGLLFAASWAFGSILSLAFSSPKQSLVGVSGPFAGAAGGAAARSSSPFAEPDRLPPQVIQDPEPPQE
jgi:hypothetical protein